jgi:hypothetical protein
MNSVLQDVANSYKKRTVVDVRSGDTVRVHQKIKEGNKERVQVFEGMVIRTSKKEPYYSTPDSNRPPSVTGDEGSGRFWDFPRGGVYPNILSKLISNNQEYKQATTMYATVDEASGYVSSAVVVSCIRNTGNLNNLSMLNSLKSKLQEYNNDKSEKGMQASTYTIKSSNEVSRWNSKVYDLTMAEYYSNPGGQPITNSIEYTMFTTPKYIYEVRVMGATDNSFVKETARKIFDNLQFTSN